MTDAALRDGVLLVEDSDDDAVLVREMLVVAAPGVGVEHAPTLMAALGRLAVGTEPACVLLDLGLPDADGVEGVAALRAAAPAVAIVVLTGRSADESFVLTAISAGADDYVAKDDLDARLLRRVISHAVERRRSEDARRAAEDRYRRIVELAAEGVWALDADGRTEVVNPRMAEIVGASVEELRGKHLSELAFPGEAEALEHALSSSRPVDVRLRRLDGSAVWGRIATAPLEGAGDAVGVLALVTDVTEQRRIQDQLTHQALHDALTGTANRALLDDRIRTAAARSLRAGTMLGLLFVDLDGFKALNDQLGHSGGDEALRAVARRLEDVVRAGDTVARFGGDEFVVLCEGLTSADEADAVARRVHAAIAAPLPERLGLARGLSASIGVVVGGGGQADAGRLLLDADAAMYAAKEAGAGCTRHFDETMRTRVQERRELEEALRAGVSSGELVLHYQPVVDLRTGALRGAEALVRWERPGHGLVPPGAFIPLAEASGLIVEIGEWTLREALRQAARWREELGERAPLPVSVNVSAREVGAGDLPAKVRAMLAETGARASDLALEITESSLLEPGPEPERVVRELRDTGVTVLLDDFGTGYSSLSCLHRLAIDVLKVDRSFVAGLDEPGGQEAAIVRAVVGMARAMGIEVIVEGVETPSQAREVALIGGDAAQGFLFSRPTTPDALAALAGESTVLADAWSAALLPAPPAEVLNPG